MCSQHRRALASPLRATSRSVSSSSAPPDFSPLCPPSRPFRGAVRAKTTAPMQRAQRSASLRRRLRPTCERGARARP
eukprot:7124884-Alexandrium_andersonii.AAC.1